MSSEDERPEICYISTHNPTANLYATIRTACVRSLSCEVAPPNVPVLFSTGSSDGEGREWGVVSYVFRVADGQARGSSRMYRYTFSIIFVQIDNFDVYNSILVMLPDTSLLVNSFAWLSSCLTSTVGDLQGRAKKNLVTPKQQPTPRYKRRK